MVSSTATSGVQLQCTAPLFSCAQRPCLCGFPRERSEELPRAGRDDLLGYFEKNGRDCKVHSRLKFFGVVKTDVNMLLVKVPNRPEECPLLHWVWMLEMIWDQVVVTFSVSSTKVVILGVVKTEQVGW